MIQSNPKTNKQTTKTKGNFLAVNSQISLLKIHGIKRMVRQATDGEVFVDDSARHMGKQMRPSRVQFIWFRIDLTTSQELEFSLRKPGIRA